MAVKQKTSDTPNNSNNVKELINTIISKKTRKKFLSENQKT